MTTKDIVLTNSQIVYFPYLFNDQFKIIDYENISLWNFSAESERRITDVKLRDYIAKLLSMNTERGEPIQNIGVITSKNIPFRVLNTTDRKSVRELRALLFISATAEQNIYSGENAGFGMITTENFTVIYQGFELNSNKTASSTGGIVRKNVGGRKIETTQYEIADHILNHKVEFCMDLFNALCVVKKNNPPLFQILYRSIESFMEGYRNAEDVSDESRILQQCRAFEILFQLPENKPRMHFKEKIKNLFPSDFAEVSFKSKQGNKTIDDKGIIPVYWADQFYSLRNSIIHGDSLGRDAFEFNNQSHIQISLWMFIISIQNICNQTLNFYDTLRIEEGKFEFVSGKLTKIIKSL